MKRQQTNPVKKYSVECTIDNLNYSYFVLAIDSNNALAMISNITDWDNITVQKLSGVVAMAKYCARNISNESEEFYLNYHCHPVSKIND